MGRSYAFFNEVAAIYNHPLMRGSAGVGDPSMRSFHHMQLDHRGSRLSQRSPFNEAVHMQHINPVPGCAFNEAAALAICNIGSRSSEVIPDYLQ